MSLIPRAIHPMTFLRRGAMRRGFQSDSQLLRLIALLMIGRPILVKQNAYRQGFVGDSRFWKVVAVAFVANDVRRKLTVREPEFLGVERIDEGQGVVVTMLTKAQSRELRRAAKAS